MRYPTALALLTAALLAYVERTGTKDATIADLTAQVANLQERLTAAQANAADPAQVAELIAKIDTARSAIPAA